VRRALRRAGAGLASAALGLALLHPASALAELPVLPEGDIRDLRGPVAIEEERSWAPYALGALAVAGAGVGARAALRRRRRGPSPEAVAEARIADAVARREAIGPDAFAAAVSEAIRAWVQDRFGIVAPLRTTEELFAELAGPTGPPALQVPELGAFLAACDRAKFGRTGVTDGDATSLVATARALVARAAHRAPGVEVRS
jgi:hypothetical protein